MRVLSVITPSRLGGAERYVGNLGKWFVDNGHECLVIVKEEGAVAAWYQQIGLPTRIVGIGGKFNPFAVRQLQAVIDSYQPDVVHAHLSTANLRAIAASKARGVPCVSHIHSHNSVGPYRKARSIIAVSKAVKQHLTNAGLDSNRISVVYPGFGSLGESVQPAADLVSPNQRLLVCAAHLREEKGVFVLLEAMRMVTAAIPECTLAFAGEGPDEARLRALAPSNVRFLGFRRDMMSVFAAADVAVLPSLAREGLPLVIAEANAVGTPVVASRIGGVPEIISDRENGLLVGPGDPQQLASAIIGLLRDESIRRKMGEKARHNSERFTIEASGQCCLEVFEQTKKRG